MYSGKIPLVRCCLSVSPLHWFYYGFNNDYWLIISGKGEGLEVTLDRNYVGSREKFLVLLIMFMVYIYIVISHLFIIICLHNKELMVKNIFKNIVALAHTQHSNEFSPPLRPFENAIHIKIKHIKKGFLGKSFKSKISRLITWIVLCFDICASYFPNKRVWFFMLH